MVLLLGRKGLASPSKVSNAIAAWYDTHFGLALSRLPFESKASEASSLWDTTLEKGVPKSLTEGSGPRGCIRKYPGWGYGRPRRWSSRDRASSSRVIDPVTIGLIRHPVVLGYDSTFGGKPKLSCLNPRELSEVNINPVNPQWPSRAKLSTQPS